MGAQSPAINAGTSLGYKRDIEGKRIKGKPDMGAYEYR
ncbi:choice-of-anchor Q domain-containing protein [Paenibacillus gorillae]